MYPIRLYIVSGILLIVPIVDFALAAPVLVQEKRQASADMVNIPAYPVVVLGKRVDGIEEVGGKYIENYFAKQEESSAALPSSSSTPSGTNPGPVGVKQPQTPIPASSTTTDEDHGYLVVPHPPPPPPPIPTSPIVSDHDLAAAHVPLSSPVLPAWYLTDHGYMGPHAPQPKLGPSVHGLTVEEPPSRPGSPTVSDGDHGYQVVHSPSPLLNSASPAESDFEMVDGPPSSLISSTNPGRWLTVEDAQLENLHAAGNTFKGNAKESRSISGTARDVLNVVARRELQRVRSLGPEE